MIKKLKLRIAKFDRILVVEQLERTGEWKNSEHIKVDGDLYLFDDHIDLQENIGDRSVSWIEFYGDAERDDYLQKMLGWITEEQFGGAGKLEIGKPCLVRSSKDELWEERIFAGKLSQNARERDALFLTESVFTHACFISWKYAKPLNSAQPTIDGEIYTWEIK